MSDLKQRVKLLPCPFCGTEANGSWSHDLYSVECATACCSQCDFSEEKAIELWNTRALTEREAKLVEFLKEVQNYSLSHKDAISGMPISEDKKILNGLSIEAKATLKSLGIEGESRE